MGRHGMAQSIHPTAMVHPQAVLGCDVEIGPYCVLEAETTVGDGCRLASHVVIKRGTTLGAQNLVDEGAILGGRPQHVARHDRWGTLVIGAGNMIREHVTIHCAMAPDRCTRVGDDNLIMVNAHVAHDCQVGHHTILTNNVMLAGHVTVGDYAYLSGGVGVHQFCRIGSHAMVGGQAHINQDVPPYVTVDGQSTRVVGLNVIGLRRRGFAPEAIQQLKEAYRIIYRHGLAWNDVLRALQTTFSSGPAADFAAFLAQGQRGFVSERRRPALTVIPLPRVAEHGGAACRKPALRRAG
jgi:UDP-N-acetylglucosamine acyltransferase